MNNILRSQASSEQTRLLSKSILRHMLINIITFTGLYIGLLLFSCILYSSLASFFTKNISGEPFYLFSGVVSLGYLVAAVGYIAGLVVMVRSEVDRGLRYFDLLLDSMSSILAKREGAVLLPSELEPTARALNRIKTENELNERTAKAAEERKNELVVYLAHDIKTPLTSIIGYLALLDESPDLPQSVRAHYIDITLAKAYSLEKLLDEFFEITRYNLQHIPIERSRFDGALFVNQVMEEFYPLAEKRDLTLTYDGPEQLPVFADAGRVARVLNNVLKNAVAYADSGTEVLLHTGLSCSDDQFVWWELTVTDHGRELTPEHLQRIFQKFFRTDEARSSGEGGSGLGLAIAREIARAHGGDIYAASEAGLTSFTVWIPLGPRVSPSQDEAKSAETLSQSSA